MKLNKLIALGLTGAMLVAGSASAETLRMAYSSAPRSIDPYPFGGTSTASLKEHVYEALVASDDSPLLSTGWTWNSQTSLTVNLRENVTFHNGDPLTARDVVYSACRMMYQIDGKRNLLTSSMGPIADVVAVDEHTVRFEMKTPYPLWIQKMKFLSILPASLADTPDGAITYDAEGDCGITRYPTIGEFENEALQSEPANLCWRGSTSPATLTWFVTTTTGAKCPNGRHWKSELSVMQALG